MTGIGVVIAARDPGPLLRETLESATTQTRAPSAVVVVDDGSEDAAAVADEAAAFPEVRLIRQAPLGRSTARNRGAAAVMGDYLLFLDADDLLRPTALEVLGRRLDGDPSLDMAHGRVFEFVDRRDPPPPGARQRDAEATARLGGSTLMRRSAWSRVGPFDETIARGEWIDWISRANLAGLVTATVDHVVLERRLHSRNSATSGDDNAQYLAVIRAALERKRRKAE